MPTIATHRRFHERTYPRSEDAAWSRRAGEPLHHASVVDYSESGIGLTLRDDQPPTTGEAVRILSRAGKLARRARVVRASTDVSGLTRLGCRWISSTDRAERHPGRLRPRPHPRARH